MDRELEHLSVAVGEALAARGWTLTTAESCTGGWIAAVVTATPGSSAWFDRGFVTYSNAAKSEMLGVKAETLHEHGAVSVQTVTEMALGALAYSAADVAVAVSGIAGPGGGTSAKPVGTVVLGWAVRGQEPVLVSRLFDGDREAVRRHSLLLALNEVIRLSRGDSSMSASSVP